MRETSVCFVSVGLAKLIMLYKKETTEQVDFS